MKSRSGKFLAATLSTLLACGAFTATAFAAQNPEVEPTSEAKAQAYGKDDGQDLSAAAVDEAAWAVDGADADGAEVPDGADSAGDESAAFDGEDGIEGYANATGWGHHATNGHVYYFEDGYPAKGSRFIDGNWYRFDLIDGHMLTGNQEIDGKMYRYHPTEGHMLFGSQYIDGKWYWYHLTEGWMLKGSQYIEDAWYRYDPEDGHMLFGSQNIDGDWYWYDLVDGKMAFGSRNIDGDWYWYSLADGKMCFGSQYIDGNWYWYSLADGKMLFGSQQIDGKWYWYDNNDGHMYMGWANIDGKWYYYHPTNGYMLTGNQVIDGKSYYFHPNEGYLISGSTAGLQGPQTHSPRPSVSYPYTLDQAINKQLQGSVTYKYADFMEYMNPNNFAVGTADAYQFLLLDSGYTGVTAEQIDKFIERHCVASEKSTGRTSTLRGLGEAIVEASKTYDVNEVYILAHAIHESGWGCSRLSTGTVAGYEGWYNFYGIGAYDADPLNGGAALAKQRGWDSPEKAIIGGAATINSWYITAKYDLGNGVKLAQNTLYKMRFAPGLANTWHQYATDIGWAKKTANYINMAYKEFGFTPTAFEWPVYA